MSGNIRFGEEDFSNPYVFEKGRRRDTRDPRTRKVIILGVVCVMVWLLMVLMPDGLFYSVQGLGSGDSISHPLSLAEFLTQLQGNCSRFLAFLTGNAPSWYVFYFCPFVVVAFSGASMALCGSVYQSAFRNPLAAPKTLGVMGGGALGALVWVLFFMNLGPQYHYNGWSYNLADYAEWFNSLDLFSQIWVTYGKALFGVLGCLFIVAVVVGIAALVGRGKISNITLIICGSVFAAGITALIQYFRYAALSGGDTTLSATLQEIETATFTGSFDFGSLLIICVPILICIVILLLMRNRLTLLSFGDEEAQSMGLSTNKTRYAMIAVCTVMIGWTVSFCGHIAFLGFITAHLTRKIIGPEIRYLLPASIFVGAMFVLIVHKLTLMGFFFAPLHSDGMWTALLGASFFLITALRQRKETRGDWL